MVECLDVLFLLTANADVADDEPDDTPPIFISGLMLIVTCLVIGNAFTR